MTHLTASDRKRRIIKLAQEPLPVRIIAERMGCSQATVYLVLREAGVKTEKWGIGKLYNNLQGKRRG